MIRRDKKGRRLCGACDAMATFGFVQKQPLCCNGHKTPDMKDVVNKMCNETGCDKRATFGYQDKKPLYCGKHRVADTRDVKNKVCDESGCDKRATCGEKGTPTKCRKHASTSPQLVSKKCAMCTRDAVYGIGAPTRCSLHKEQDMVNVKTPRCDYKGCQKHPHFGYTVPVRCDQHKEPDMVNVKGKRCEHEGCESLGPSFGFPGARRGSFCSKHKTDEMVDIKNTKCSYQDCTSTANPKYSGYCVQHFIQEFPDDPRTANVGKSGAEVDMEAWLDKYPMVKFYTKTAIQCDGRQLFPDALVTLTNGHQVLIECDGP